MDTLLLLLRSISILSFRFFTPSPLPSSFVHHADHEQIGTMLLYSPIVSTEFVCALSRLFSNMVQARWTSIAWTLYRIERIDLGDESRTRCLSDTD